MKYLVFLLAFSAVNAQTVSDSGVPKGATFDFGEHKIPAGTNKSQRIKISDKNTDSDFCEVVSQVTKVDEARSPGKLVVQDSRLETIRLLTEVGGQGHSFKAQLSGEYTLRCLWRDFEKDK